jgi:hypothetical protein
VLKCVEDASLFTCPCTNCRKGIRTETSIVAETAQCYSTHQICVLIGYGAHAICPYLAFETCRQWRQSNRYWPPSTSWYHIVPLHAKFKTRICSKISRGLPDREPTSFVLAASLMEPCDS